MKKPSKKRNRAEPTTEHYTFEGSITLRFRTCVANQTDELIAKEIAQKRLVAIGGPNVGSECDYWLPVDKTQTPVDITGFEVRLVEREPGDI